jgi:hypothetical protein
MLGPAGVLDSQEQYGLTPDPYAGTYFDRNNVGSGVYGYDSGDDNIWNNYMPFTSSVWKIYQGHQAGDTSQMAAGGGWLLFDIATFGEGSVGAKALGLGTAEVLAERILLSEALAKVGGSRAVQTFLGWGSETVITKSAADFTKEQLISSGYTKQVLMDIYVGLIEAGRKTIPSTGLPNPASVARANQVKEILHTFF